MLIKLNKLKSITLKLQSKTLNTMPCIVNHPNCIWNDKREQNTHTENIQNILNSMLPG